MQGCIMFTNNMSFWSLRRIRCSASVLWFVTEPSWWQIHSTDFSCKFFWACQWQCYAGFRLTCRLPHCRFAAWSSLAVSELQLSAATPLWLYHRAASLPSWIEFNCLRSAAVGKAARLSINWLDAAWRCLPLGHPSAASGACAVVQISSSKRQCGKRQVSLKAALWPQGNSNFIAVFDLSTTFKENEQSKMSP